MVPLLLTVVLAQTPATPPPDGAPAAAPAPAPTPAVESALEEQLGRLPSFFWNKERPWQERVGRLATFVLIGVGLASLAVASVFASTTAAIQLSPYPKSPTANEVPRVRYAEVTIAITAVTTVLGVVGVAVGVFALLVG